MLDSHPHCGHGGAAAHDGDAALRGVLGRRQRRGAAARRGGGGGRAARRAVRAAAPRRARARAASIDAEASLDGFLEDAYALAALATPSELTQLIAEAGGTARAVSLVATFLRVVDGHQLGLGTGIDALAPVARDAKLREALRAAAAADNGYDYRCVVWDLGGLQLYRLRDAVRWSESSPRCVASGALFFLERDTFVPARHVMQAANTGFLEQIHYQNQLKVAAASAGRFVGFLEDGRADAAGRRAEARVPGAGNDAFATTHSPRRLAGARSAARAFCRTCSISAVNGCVPPSTRRAIRPTSSNVVTASRRSSSVASSPLVERPRVIRPDSERVFLTLAENASRHGYCFAHQRPGFFEALQIDKGIRVVVGLRRGSHDFPCHGSSHTRNISLAASAGPLLIVRARDTCPQYCPAQ